MINAEKVNEFLNEAKVFAFLTADGDQPEGRPSGFHLLLGDKLYFGCGTFKNVFKQLTANPKAEVLALNNDKFPSA
ncbi:MAG: pyridoxamine 5'-phosphate oxidase family protein [Bulleidia sp.]